MLDDSWIFLFPLAFWAMLPEETLRAAPAVDFVTRRWIRCPVEGRRDWEGMRQRYGLDSPGRFPADFADRCLSAAGRTGVLRVTFPGPFWQMREWCGLEGLCLLMIEAPALVDTMAAFWTEFVAAPFLRLSPTAQNRIAFGRVVSSRKRPTTTSSRPATSMGVGTSSVYLTPSARPQSAFASSSDIGARSSTLTDMA